jgi:hypothetical protein
MSSKGPAKGAATIHRLLEERRKYEAWLGRLRGAADATAEGVRSRVESDYAARLKAVNEELKVHTQAVRELIAQRQEAIDDLRDREQSAAERLSEGELRHTVGEYDEEQWTQFRKDALSELVTVREELQALEADLAQLQEVNTLVTQVATGAAAPAPAAASPAPSRPAPRVGPPPRPQTTPAPAPREPAKKVDELAFIKSMTEDERGPSSRRASGAQFQPAEPQSPPPGGTSRLPAAPGATEDPLMAETKADGEAPRTLRCPECGTMNTPTEWYCEQCGAELAAL